VENKKMKETESSWLAQHPEIRQKYRGEYIAVSGQRVLAHGKILKDVMDQARKTDPDPLLCKVPTQDILVV
jgi:hypothetical protein